jgi:hypothetical protein
MPFDDAMIDVFTLGIAWVADRIGIAAQRADQLEHNGDIISVIQKAIREYDVIIADTTVHKTNVFYEVGYAHVLEKDTILICNQNAELPFDIRGFNHVVYRSVSHLREVLEPRLRATLRLTP